MSRKRSRTARIRTQSIPWLSQPFQQLVSPIPPTEWCSPQQVDEIHRASMRILEEVGIDFFDEEALGIWETAGARVDHNAQHVWIDRGLLLEAVEQAPAQFTWHARNPAYSLKIGGNHINFCPNSGMPYVSDLDGGRRTSTLQDFENFVKLAHSVPLFHFTGGPLVEPQDIRNSLRHLYRMRVMALNTDRAIRDTASGRIISQDTVEMAKILFGGELPGAVIGGVVNVNSPLRYDSRMLGGLITYAKAGQVPIITPFIMAGAMSPVTLASALAQQNAEALAGVALTQLINPGTPVVYGGFTQNVDMRSGSPAFGGPEGAWGLFVGAQMARRYRLPFRGSGSLTNSKTPDAQAAYESQWTMWPAVMAHTNIVLHGVGWLESGLVASYEKFVIDAENLAMFTHFLNNFQISESAFALDSIAEVGAGGHHFGTEHTQARYKTAFYEPVLTDRRGYEPWLASGAEDALTRANKIWKELLNNHESPALDPAIRDELDDFIARRERELEGVDLFA
ncbi:MAG: trimethylamine methyltransferase family protein [Chloroflexota bacterium]